MKRHRPRFVLLLGAIICQTLFARAQEPAASPASPHPAAPLKLLFSSPQDFTDTWGQLRIGATPVRQIREVERPEFDVVGCFPMADGAWEVFGQQMTQVGPQGNPDEEITSWKLIRSTTRDGVTFENPEVVIDHPAGAWTRHVAMAYNPDAHEYLLLKLKVDSTGFAYTAFFSPDGEQWQPYADNPLFYDGDAMSLFWSPVLKQYVSVSKSLQPHHKHIQDHGGATRSLGDDTLRDRRVLVMRSSLDGRQWEPSKSMHDVWNRHGKKGSVPSEFMTMPDASDPPDLEFYSGNAFWYHDRAYMMVLNYAASPLLPSQHGPSLDNEWWTSIDGLRWERPARDVNALAVFPEVQRLETHPMTINGMTLFQRSNQLFGLPEDRISFVSARANAEFSTRSFEMQDANLLLNAAVPSLERPFAQEQAYIMVALLDENGTVIPGFEAEKCVIRNEDRRDIPLNWGDASVRDLAGKTIRLRFYLRSSNIYAVTADSIP